MDWEEQAFRSVFNKAQYTEFDLLAQLKAELVEYQKRTSMNVEDGEDL